MGISGRRSHGVLVAVSAGLALAVFLPASAGSSVAWKAGSLRLSQEAVQSYLHPARMSTVRGAVPRALVRSMTRPFGVLSPTSTGRAQGDGIDLSAPANGSSWPDTATISFAWSEAWYCPECDGVEVFLVATDPALNNVVSRQAGPCPASSAPSCPTSTTAGPFPAGTYYWAVGLQLGSNPVHVSDEWSFTVTGGAAPPPPPPPPPTPPPAGATTFTDTTGDGNGAPDVTGVTVSNDANGQITMQINVPGLASIAADEVVLVRLDTDQNPATGHVGLGGVEYIWLIDGATQSFVLLQWNGSTFVQAPANTASVHASNGPVLSINRSELGGAGVTGFNFAVTYAKGAAADNHLDNAPDTGTWNYKLTAGATTPPATTPPAAKATVSSIRVLSLPAAPTAGLRFRVLVPSIRLSSGATVHPDSARCVARVTGKILRGTAVGGCTFAIPKTAGGKLLVVQVTIRYKGMTKTRTVAFRIRRP
jgi:hypothetical protein